MLKDIIRFKKNGKQKLIHYKVTEEQAREWCESPHTRGKDYFDGFATSGTYCHRQQPKYTHYFTPDEKYN
jgi:hypothetical protein